MISRVVDNTSEIVMMSRSDYSSLLFILSVIQLISTVIALSLLVYSAMRMYGWINKPALFNYQATIEISDIFLFDPLQKHVEIPVLINRDRDSASRSREFTMQVFLDNELVCQNSSLRHESGAAEMLQIIAIQTKMIDIQKEHSVTVVLYPNDTRLLKDKMVRVFSKIVSFGNRDI